MNELDKHMMDTCYLAVNGGSESTEGKVNILLQTYISKQLVENFSLVSDMSYVAQVSYFFILWSGTHSCKFCNRFLGRFTCQNICTDVFNLEIRQCYEFAEDYSQ